MLELKIFPYPFHKSRTEASIENLMDPLRVNLPPNSSNTKISPVSSAHGKIKTLVFTIPNGNKARKKYNFFPILKEIIEKMSATVEEFVIIHPQQESDYFLAYKKELERNKKVHFLKTINKDDDLDIWVQDYFYPLKLETNEQKHICLAVGIINQDSSTITKFKNPITLPTTLSTLKIEYTKLPFEGGNILVGDDFLLVGISNKHTDYEQWFGRKPIFIGTTISSAKNPFNVPQEFEDGFKNELPRLKHAQPPGRKLIGQPLLHIDMFITLAGYNEDKTEYTFVVGKPQISTQTRANMLPDLLTAIDDWLKLMEDSISKCIQKLKEDFASLLNKSIKTIEIPLVLTYKDHVTPARQKRKWFWATYNNCLVEIVEKTANSDGFKKVWLPSYGNANSDYSSLKMAKSKQNTIRKKLHKNPNKIIKYGSWTNLEAYDKIVQSKWSSLGFKVCYFEQSYIPLISRRGSLNCITNVIDRL